MAEFQEFSRATLFTPAALWKVAEESVIAAGTALAGVTPNVWTPLNRYIPDKHSLRKYYNLLRDILARRGWQVDLLSAPPIPFDKVATSNFFDMVSAVDALLHAQAPGEE